MKTQDANEPDSFLTVPEVAKRYRMHSTTVSKLCRAGDLPGAYRNGKGRGHWRIPILAINAYVQQRAQQTA